MPFTLTMPKLSPTMENGVIARWLKKEGEHVLPGEAILEISTDKATLEHSALDEGFLRKILVKEGDTAAINVPIAILTESETESIEGYTPQGVESAPEVPKQAVKEEPVAKVQEPKLGERIIASPLAKKLAGQRGIDLTTIQGSGPRGRIVSKDLEGKAERKHSLPGQVEKATLTPIRQVIAKRLKAAKQNIPHFYLTVKVDAVKLVELREELSTLDVKVTVNDMIVRAIALALDDHPDVNVNFDEEKGEILKFSDVDVSVAVNTNSGLITPIVRQASTKSLLEISLEIRALAEKAKKGMLRPDEFQGGTFTVSNLGMYGTESFQAIINPPQGAIVAVGTIQEEPVVKDGLIVPGKIMRLTFSYDHRVIDGALGAIFAQLVKKYLEHPSVLLL